MRFALTHPSPSFVKIKKSTAWWILKILIWRMVRDYLGTLCLRCNRDDFTTLTFVKSTCCRTQATSLQGLIPGHNHDKNKTPTSGCLIFMADGEGFEPPDELPRQRFSRPSHSTALPTIQNSFRDGSFKPAVLVMRKLCLL